MLNVIGFLACLTISASYIVPTSGCTTTGPCTLTSSIDRQYVDGLDATCDGNNPTDPAEEECVLEKGETFTIDTGVCGANANPFYANDAAIGTPTDTLTVVCDGTTSTVTGTGVTSTSGVTSISCGK